MFSIMLKQQMIAKQKPSRLSHNQTYCFQVGEDGCHAWKLKARSKKQVSSKRLDEVGPRAEHM